MGGGEVPSKLHDFCIIKTSTIVMGRANAGNFYSNGLHHDLA